MLRSLHLFRPCCWYGTLRIHIEIFSNMNNSIKKTTRKLGTNLKYTRFLTKFNLIFVNSLAITNFNTRNFIALFMFHAIFDVSN